MPETPKPQSITSPITGRPITTPERHDELMRQVHESLERAAQIEAEFLVTHPSANLAIPCRHRGVKSQNLKSQPLKPQKRK